MNDTFFWTHHNQNYLPCYSASQEIPPYAAVKILPTQGGTTTTTPSPKGNFVSVQIATKEDHPSNVYFNGPMRIMPNGRGVLQLGPMFVARGAAGSTPGSTVSADEAFFWNVSGTSGASNNGKLERGEDAYSTVSGGKGGAFREIMGLGRTHSVDGTFTHSNGEFIIIVVRNVAAPLRLVRVTGSATNVSATTKITGLTGNGYTDADGIQVGVPGLYKHTVSATVSSPAGVVRAAHLRLAVTLAAVTQAFGYRENDLEDAGAGTIHRTAEVVAFTDVIEADNGEKFFLYNDGSVAATYDNIRWICELIAPGLD